MSKVPAVLLALSLTAPLYAGANRYQYRAKDSSANPTWKIPQFIIADTEADLPTGATVSEGDMAYTKDTDRVWKRTASAWAEVAGSGGGGGSANVAEVEVDFGSTGDTNKSVVVTGQSWVTSTSKIVCVPTLQGTADRAEGAEDALIEGLSAGFHTRVAGVGFTVAVAAAQGRAYGRFVVHCSGA